MVNRLWGARASLFLGAPLASARMLFAVFLLGSCVYGIGVYAFTQLIGAIVDERHWNRATLGIGVAAFWLAAPVTLVVPNLVARYGFRAVLLFGGLLEASALAGISLLDGRWPLFFARFLMGVGKAAVAVAIVLLLAELYKRRSSMAISIALAGWHFGGIWAVTLTNLMLQSGLGWRAVVSIEAAILFLATIGSAAMIPRGSLSGMTGSARTPLAEHSERTRVSNLIPAFLIASFFFYAGYGALLTHVTPFLLGAGVSHSQAGVAVASISLTAMFGVLFGGALTQRVAPAPLGAALFGLLLLVSSVLSVYRIVDGVGVMIATAWGLGAVIGAGDPIFVEFLRRAVGPARYSRIFGLWYFVVLGSLFIGPYIAGYIYDSTGSYRFVFGAIGALSGMVSVVYWLNARRLPVTTLVDNMP